MAKNLYNDPRPSLQTFVAALIRECMSTDPPVALRAELHGSIEALSALVNSGEAVDEWVESTPS
jgi:CCR4-NOT transcription complex subunit 1